MPRRGSARRNGPSPARVAAAVLSRFDPDARPMPWRLTRDPYRIWLSEIMLQQTTVAAVGPYYRRFLEKFPSVGDLARAPTDEVLKAWEGLGYYARARNLHAAARAIVSRHGGRIPETVEGLAALPGIGRSTAGAISAIAFGRDAPVLDANVKRVLARLFGVEGDLERADSRRLLWDLASRIVVPGRGRETALAFMDLGSVVCKPRKPDCAACPANRLCAAFRDGTQEAIPFRRLRAKRPHFDIAIPIVEDGKGRLLILRRPERDILGGLWAFPGGRVREGEAPGETASRVAREKAGLAVKIVGPVGAVEHGYSHYRVTLHAYRCRRLRGRPGPDRPWRWIRPEALEDVPFVVSNRKLAALLRG